MRLAVIGDTQHYRDETGRLCALEPVVNQLDRWAALFDEVVICAPLDPGPPSRGVRSVPSRRTSRSTPLRRSGGNTLAGEAPACCHVVPWAIHPRRVAGASTRSTCGARATSRWSRSSRRGRSVVSATPCTPGCGTTTSAKPGSSASSASCSAPLVRRPGQRLRRSGRPDRPHLEPFFSPSFSSADWERRPPSGGREGRASRRPRRRRAVAPRHRRPPDREQEPADDRPRDRPSGRCWPGRDARRLRRRSVQRPQLEELADELGIADRVTFHGSGRPRR